MTTFRTSPPVTSRPASFLLAAALLALVAVAPATPATVDASAPLEGDVVETIETVGSEDGGFDLLDTDDAPSAASAAASPCGEATARVTWCADERPHARIDAPTRAIPPPARG